MHAYTPYLDWIDTQQPALLQRVKEWVSINTYSFNISGLEQFITFLQLAFKSLEGEEFIYPLPAQRTLGSDGKFHLKALGPAFSLKKRPNAPFQVLLAGHYDTVYPPSLNGSNITELAPGIWKGQGISDMKSGIAILLTALEALERAPYSKNIGWEVLLTPDEEIGSPGSLNLYESAALRTSCALVFEPSFPDGAFVSERKGSATFTVVVKGKSAHVGRDYLKGRNAVFSLARLIQKLETLKENQDLIINAADLDSNGPVNIVPSLASCKINIRSSKNEKIKNSLPLLQKICDECQQEGIEFEILQDALRGPKLLDKATQNLFDAYSRCANDLHLPFHVRPTGGVCDGNTLSAAGLPTLDTAGAVGGSLHTPDEYLICSSLVERSKLAALFLLKLANGEIALGKEK